MTFKGFSGKHFVLEEIIEDGKLIGTIVVREENIEQFLSTLDTIKDDRKEKYKAVMRREGFID